MWCWGEKKEEGGSPFRLKKKVRTYCTTFALISLTFDSLEGVDLDSLFVPFRSKKKVRTNCTNDALISLTK